MIGLLLLSGVELLGLVATIQSDEPGTKLLFKPRLGKYGFEESAHLLSTQCRPRCVSGCLRDLGLSPDVEDGKARAEAGAQLLVQPHPHQGRTNRMKSRLPCW